MKPSVLAIFPFTPNDIRLRSRFAMEALASLFELDVIYLQDTSEPITLPEFIRQVWVIPNSSKVTRALRLIAGLVRGWPMTHEFYNSPKLKILLKMLPLYRYQAIYVERLPVHRLELRHPQVIYDCVDCYSEQTRQLARSLPGPRRAFYAIDALLLPSEERKACSSASHVLVTATREVERLRNLGVKVPISDWVVGRRSMLSVRKLQKRSKFIISFHGKLSYPANLLALKDISESIAPKLSELRTELRIIGKSTKRIEGRFKNLQFTGYVPSIEDAVRESDVSIFPMRIGVGWPNKAMESLAYGVPIIATEEVVEGLPCWEPLRERGVYVRRIEDFAEQVSALMELPIDVRQTIAAGCHAWAKAAYDSLDTQFSWESMFLASPDDSVEEFAYRSY
jgi:glycosyltransferase involved in cell wall biosynthesis